MTPIQHIEDELEIRDLVSRFADILNRNALGELGELFAPDGALEVVGEGTHVGASAIEAFFSDTLAAWSGFMHAVHAGRVQLGTGPRPLEAKGRWYLSEFGLREGVDTCASGAFTDQYRKGPDGWRFARRRYDRYYFRAGNRVSVHPLSPELG